MKDVDEMLSLAELECIFLTRHLASTAGRQLLAGGEHPSGEYRAQSLDRIGGFRLKSWVENLKSLKIGVLIWSVGTV